VLSRERLGETADVVAAEHVNQDRAQDPSRDPQKKTINQKTSMNRCWAAMRQSDPLVAANPPHMFAPAPAASLLDAADELLGILREANTATVASLK
jgi:hypothetical protein